MSLATSSTGWAGKGTARRRTVDMFIVHHAATTSLAAVRNMFGGLAYEVSANYIVKDDQIVAAVPESLRAWTSGSANDGGKGADFDHRALTVETCNSATGEPWPISEASYRSLARMAADFHRRYGVPLDRDHIVGHGELWSRWRASYATRCPGGIDLDRIVRDARAIANGEEEDMPTADEIAAAIWRYPMQGGSKMPNGKTVAAETAGERLRQVRRSTDGLQSRTITIRAEAAALRSAVATLAKSQGVDPDTITATVDAAVREALADLSITLTAEGED